jgi:two-component system chemotaxis response regulator CheB
VLVVDDTAVVRRMVSDILDAEPGIQVVGTARDGVSALRKVAELRPDVVTLDVEMPGMDGLEAMRHLGKDHPGVAVIMFSTLTESGATATLEALSRGARDYVTKPSGTTSREQALAEVRDALVPRVLQWGPRPETAPVELPALPRTRSASHRSGAAVGLVVIGVSTGGPNALAEVIGALPGPLAVPVVIVQHMPPVFTRLLSERLDVTCKVPVVEAQDGMELLAGRVHIAQGGSHLVLRRQAASVRLALDDGPPEQSCRPAVDVLFRSAAKMYGDGVLAVVLTGMGRDGLNGSEAVVAAGGTVLAQDEATSVVWGMPGFVARAGLASQVLPLQDVAVVLERRVGLATTTGVVR